MITREECIARLLKDAECYRNAPKDFPEATKEKKDEWKKRAEIYEMAAKAVAEERNIR